MDNKSDNKFDFSLDKSVEILTNFTKSLPFPFPVKIVEDKAYEMGIVADSKYSCESFQNCLPDYMGCTEGYKLTYQERIDLNLVDNSKIIIFYHFGIAYIGVTPASGTEYSGEYKIQIWGTTQIPSEELFK